MDPSIELWRPVPEYEGYYSVSSLGRVRSEEREVRDYRGVRRLRTRVMKLCKTRRGYFSVGLHKDGHTRTRHVHSLVTSAFLGPRPPGKCVLHGPAGKLCNALSNLSYGTIFQNNGPDKIRDGTDNRGEKNHKAKLTAADVRFIRASNERGSFLAKNFGVTRTTICDIRKHKIWAHV
jgi:hypothetical protein